MLANDRKQKILAHLNQHVRATLEELQSLTDSSVSTIRRDLNELEEDQLLRRIHGGAELLQDFSTELTMIEKYSKNVQEKFIIAKKAVKKIANGDTIYLDAGTTTGALIPEMNQLNIHLTVVTSSATHASLLTNEKINVYILGGMIKKSTDSVIGGLALDQLRTYRFNVAFLGANGFDAQNGAMTPDSEEAAIKRQAVLQSQQSYLLMDRSKLGQTSFVRFATKDEVEVITE
ncbi:DeoR family transcriptional regulator [Lactococcus hircilactis]|uniref:DeoR family transcriptional regulator n=1 Tax=Lactococcus hircilactis TaxID=1494462 RepID=A0A7X1Z769_9LACT|nr:DeoR family transcriptional regulator [Lactococcus hircilactis]